MSRVSAFGTESTENRLPAAEAQLLTKINQGFPDAWWDHYDELVGKRQAGRLSSSEHRELIRLTDQLEVREAKRLQALVRLAKLRKQALPDLMKALGLRGRTDG
jgi:hypothetical protein